MTDHTDKRLQLGNLIFDDKNQERQSENCFGQTCNWSLVVFICQYFVILLILACFFKIITLTETCDNKTVLIAIFSGTIVYILRSQNYRQIIFYERTNVYFIGWNKWIWKISFHPWLVNFWTFHPKLTKISFLNNTINLFTNFCSKT